MVAYTLADSNRFGIAGKTATEGYSFKLPRALTRVSNCVPPSYYQSSSISFEWGTPRKTVDETDVQDEKSTIDGLRTSS